MTTDAGDVAAAVAVEWAADMSGRVAGRWDAIARDHRGSEADGEATFASVSDALLAVASLHEELPHVRCGLVILDGDGRVQALSAAREAALEAGPGQTVVSAMRHGATIRLGVLQGDLESLIMANAMSQAAVTTADDEPISTADELRERLSPAEYRVAEAVGQGATNKEVAARLYISAKTVDYHLQNIYRKLGARSRTELAVLVAGPSRPATDSGLTRDQLRFLQALADQPSIAKWGSGVPGLDLSDETGD
ncbi:MAG TPA: LuxR C-terminal-related transcriptional regulator [Aeromicrobium sp.]|nr:LuxR C-terminal-related transcriptional regulator [Aeromicrobium sp.]